MMRKLTRDEMIERVQRIMDVDGTDKELESLANEIDACIPHLDIIDLIYDGDQSMTAEEIVDKALAYKPHVIYLPASLPEPDSD